jgi:methylmalonyl-CoA mutase
MEHIDVLKVDNRAVREQQLTRLAQLKAGRDGGKVEVALDALTRSAETGEGNLLDLSVNAARARATVGEISEALEKVFGRHQADIRSIQGVYSGEMEQMGRWNRWARNDLQVSRSCGKRWSASLGTRGAVRVC